MGGEDWVARASVARARKRQQVEKAEKEKIAPMHGGTGEGRDRCEE